ncbi:OsmC family protein [Brumicola nitratireducens]|uniref:OsmC-like protein n=1 Tax=Glaciecola nitratireducens (strain JCM 12485 / KCTC 12276 / FR1064) TaxID=1085623 RepID=G4QIX9_GLANF|nr:OsmC family protein [Glaciecola nitratireducens]AEP28318.1 OsmC-like protein [Glaciecola nitratireducens FR1064]
MQDLPHQYHVQAQGKPGENLDVCVENVPKLTVAPPAQFGGPGDEWSPEDLFMASISSCFILSFRAIAKASKFTWSSIQCDSTGTLERVEGKTRFTKIITKATLVIPSVENIENAERLLHKAEQSCLVVNSLTSESELQCEISILE